MPHTRFAKLSSRRSSSLVEPLESRRMFATLTTLASFSTTSGAVPRAGLTLSGNILYGTTDQGGANSLGTVFSVPTAGGPPTTLATFNNTNGANPVAGLTLSGNKLYGTTSGGGTAFLAGGTVFSLPITGGTPTTLVTFNSTNGFVPSGGVTLSGSTLYGTTQAGGAGNLGTVFSVSVTGGAPTPVVTFNGTNGKGPGTGLTLSGSTLYGTTRSGGANNQGTVFSVPITGGTVTTLATFNTTNGAFPAAGLTLSGNTLYGTTSTGGAGTRGTVFSVPVTGGTLTTLASFNGTNGSTPFAGLTLLGTTLYGTTSGGGTNGLGTVFSVPVSGGAPNTVVTFDRTNGANPQAGLIADAAGNLYSTTAAGGANDLGSVFKLSGLGSPAPSRPEVSVLGNSLPIADNDAFSTTADHSDFGTVNFNSPLTRTYTVRNTGTATLTTRSLTVPVGFVIDSSDPLASSIARGGSDTFKVRLIATTSGTFQGNISFTNNDADENPYNFAIKGIVRGANAEVDVRGDNRSIVDGDTAPRISNFTDFGLVARNAPGVVRTFTILNTGSATLNLSGLGVFFPGTNNASTLFTIVTRPPAFILGGQSATFSLRLNTSSAGTFIREVRFTTNDANEATYNFNIKGVVTG